MSNPHAYTETADSGRPTRPPAATTRAVGRAVTKVPEITAIFWVLKLLTTGMGEAMSDFLGQKNVPLAGVIGIFGMWLALRLQLRQREYRAPYYWFAVMMVAIFGTMVADGIRDGASIPYDVTTPLFALVTAAIFFVLVPQRGHALDPQHRHPPARAVLLGGGAGDVRARHRRRRPHRLPAELGLLALGGAVRRGHRDPGDRLVALSAQPDLRVLVRLHRHASARRLFRRRIQQAEQRRARSRRRPVSAVALLAFIGLVAYVVTVTKRDVQSATTTRALASTSSLRPVPNPSRMGSSRRSSTGPGARHGAHTGERQYVHQSKHSDGRGSHRAG